MASLKQHDTTVRAEPVTRTADAPPGPFDADMTDEELLAKYVELERFTETHGESFADGFVRVMHKKAVLLRMKVSAPEKPAVQP